MHNLILPNIFLVSDWLVMHTFVNVYFYLGALNHNLNFLLNFAYPCMATAHGVTIKAMFCHLEDKQRLTAFRQKKLTYKLQIRLHTVAR